MASQFCQILISSLLLACLLWGNISRAQPGPPPEAGEDEQPSGQQLTVGVMDLEIPLTKLVQTIVQDAYVRIGIIPRFVRNPPRRSLMLTSSGAQDAELFRAPLVEALFPELVRVDFPLYTVEVMAYTLNPGLPIFACEDLRDYKVGVVRGIILMERCAEGAGQLIRAPDTQTLVELLLQTRVDVVLTERAQGEIIILPAAPGDIVSLPEPLLSTPIYHYLHRKHAKLAEKLKLALTQMHTEGALATREMQWRIEQIPTAASSNPPDPGAGTLLLE